MGYNVSNWPNVNFPYQTILNTKICRRCYDIFKGSSISSVPGNASLNVISTAPVLVASATVSFDVVDKFILTDHTIIHADRLHQSAPNLVATEIERIDVVPSNPCIPPALIVNDAHLSHSSISSSVPSRTSSNAVPNLVSTKLESIDISASSPSNQQPQRIRKVRDYGTLAESTQYARDKRLRLSIEQAEIRCGVTVQQANLYPAKVSIKEAIKLPQSVRDKVKKAVGSVHMPSTTTVNKVKKSWATLYGTKTANVAGNGLDGAYITDPLKLVQAVSQVCTDLIVSGDAGDH